MGWLVRAQARAASGICLKPSRPRKFGELLASHPLWYDDQQGFGAGALTRRTRKHRGRTTTTRTVVCSCRNCAVTPSGLGERGQAMANPICDRTRPLASTSYRMAAAAVIGLALSFGASPAPVFASSQSFSYTGSTQTFTVPS